MADRNYRVSYKTREVDHDEARFEEARRRLPTALDPYRYPEDREELKRAVAETKARNARYRDDYREYEAPIRRQTLREDVVDKIPEDLPRPSATKTTYSVTAAGLEKESQVMTRGPTAPVDREAGSVRARQGQYEDNNKYIAARSEKPSDRRYDDRYYGRKDRDYEVERPRYEGGAYVVDMRDADVVDIYSGSRAREPDRGFGGYRNDRYNDPAPEAHGRSGGYRSSGAVYAERDNQRASAAYMSGARQDRAPTRFSAKMADNEAAVAYTPSMTTKRRDEDDFTFVERSGPRDRAPVEPRSSKESFYAAAETPKGRVRAEVNRSPPDNDYVMVSPPRDNATIVSGRMTANTGGASMRSAMFQADAYTPEERLHRRRSRSINFRNEDTDGHYAGDKFHEKPGAEAAMLGRYLNHYDVEEDRMDYRYSSKGGRVAEDDYYDRRERDNARYAPQRARSKSRGRREREEDDRSYVDTFREKTTKTTYY
ncbi:hypothetical protein LTS08_000710 [Lithohypha guttulata]|nr:hypothetical protein LTS08_000710 [Lithohypha guttulata]